MIRSTGSIWMADLWGFCMIDMLFFAPKLCLGMRAFCQDKRGLKPRSRRLLHFDKKLEY